MSQIIDLREVRQREGERLKDKKHLAWVAEQGCAVCGHRPVEVHHLLYGPDGKTQRGLSKKAGDDQTVPLCPPHHREAHRRGRSYEQMYGLQATAKWFWEVRDDD